MSQVSSTGFDGNVDYGAQEYFRPHSQVAHPRIVKHASLHFSTNSWWASPPIQFLSEYFIAFIIPLTLKFIKY